MKRTYFHVATMLLLQAGVSAACVGRPDAHEDSVPLYVPDESAVKTSSQSAKTQSIAMPTAEKIAALTKSMLSYRALSGAEYTENDVGQCIDILTTYVKNMASTSSKAEGMNEVKSAVLKLNELNERAGGDMIETGEREAIAEIIILAGHDKGYNAQDEDITEQWREW